MPMVRAGLPGSCKSRRLNRKQQLQLCGRPCPNARTDLHSVCVQNLTGCGGGHTPAPRTGLPNTTDSSFSDVRSMFSHRMRGRP